MKTTASFLLLLGFALFSLVAAIPAPAPKCDCGPKKADDIALKTTLAQFQKQRKAKSPKCCDWKSDGCSDPFPNIDVMLPFEGTFLSACQRHDFGYRNTVGTMTNALRKKIDAKFKQDMMDSCKKVSTNTRFLCQAAAWAYWGVVRVGNEGSEVKNPFKKPKNISLR
jgi:hypothetical protein